MRTSLGLPRSVKLGTGALSTALLCAATITGCASSPQRDTVRTTAVRFVQAVQSKNGPAACALLTCTAR